MSVDNKNNRVIIVGAGLCGSLLAIMLAERGYLVCLHEKRGDLRKTEEDAGRSINLALSARGLWALERAGIKEDILDVCIPMHGRMVHPKGQQSFLSSYSGRKEDYINSVSRGGLNIALLNKAEQYPNLDLHFNSKCIHVDLENAKASFQDLITEDTTVEEGDVVIGTDGAGSVVRRAMIGQSTRLLFNYSQDFLRHGYKELSIHPDANGGFKIEKNALHIWPRGEYMIIALPNLDASFTLTMFHPFEGPAGFNTLNDPNKLEAFFNKEYPELLPYIPHYKEEYFENPVGTLGTIKCYPWQAYGKALIMGDAAHAVVPFYGQGMNASFEDVRVFDEVLDQYEGDWLKIFEVFQDLRAENANAIADLAKDNFFEMRDKVDDEPFKRKRKIEMQLEQQYKDYYSKYSLVTFRPELDYKKAMELGRKQDELLLEICKEAHLDNLSMEGVYHQLKDLQN